jgi:hypothetical protein
MQALLEEYMTLYGWKYHTCGSGRPLSADTFVFLCSSDLATTYTHPREHRSINFIMTGGSNGFLAERDEHY